MRSPSRALSAAPSPLVCASHNRRLGETAGEIMKVADAGELSSSNKNLKWQLALRNPYLDPVNVMQVG